MIYKTELAIRWDMLRYLCVTTHAIQTGFTNSDYAFFTLKFNTYGKQNKLQTTGRTIFMRREEREFTNSVILCNRDYLKV